MKKSYLTILPMALLASCSSELIETADNASKGNVEKVSIQSHPFEFEDGTRTLLTATDKGISFAWASYDALGVFPVSPTTNSQAEQKINVPAGCEPQDAHFASFDGAGWGLKIGNTYAAYVPYNGELPSATPYTAVPIDMNGQDGTLTTIGQKYDYMCAPSSANDAQCATNPTHELVFDFQHVVSILQFKLTMPVAATWKSIVITNDAGDKVWTTSATMNVATGAVTSTTTASSISLALSGVTTTAEGQEVVLYASVLPTTTGALTLTATTSADEEYTASLASKTLVAGKAYRYTVSELQAQPTYEAVDLGLSVKWATMNVGAQSETDYGDYFAWGETEPQSSNRYYWDSYKWGNGTSSSMTKYCVSTLYGTVDNNTTLDAEDDAASVNWGGAWRMPTHAEQVELVSNCTWKWVTSYNNVSVNGYVVTGSNGNSIFLPAAGYRSNGSLLSAGSYGDYWSSSLHESYSYRAWRLDFASYSRSSNNGDNRSYGLSVRAVCE
ncbi:MAG: fimbrillin family protein [Bacteroidaceae bacterium]|nr:fimbrillin family protein [Bacteroidaceae bacterium]